MEKSKERKHKKKNNKNTYVQKKKKNWQKERHEEEQNVIVGKREKLGRILNDRNNSQKSIWTKFTKIKK